ncbi:MAG: heme o synthase [Planctomycetota bacterium]|nr:heme o synthase [Planctomycetota bacterium]
MNALASSPTAIPLRQKVGAFVELGKLRLSSLAIFAVIAGLYLGYPSFEDPPGWLVAATAIGSLAIAAAGNALNQYIERDIDPLMERTRGRPVPSGRLTPREALWFGIVGGALGLAVIAATTNLLATLTSVAIFVTYVFVYTPMKRVSPLNTLVGAIPGALPPVVGYAAATGTLDVQAGLLFGIVFLWQMPHFFAISWRYRDDYARGGMKMLAVTDADGFVLRRQMLVYTVALVLVSFLPFKTGLAGEAYLASAALLGLLFMAPVTAAVLLRLESAMRLTFLASIISLPLLFVALVADRV